MATPTLLGNTFTTTAGVKTVTATPAVGDLIVVFTGHTGILSSDLPTDDQGGTYSLVTSSNKAGGVEKLAAFVRNSLISSAVSTVFTHDPSPTGTSTGGGLAVVKITGMTRSGLSAILQSQGTAFGAGSTPAPVLGAVPQSGNPILGAMWNGANPATMTPRTGYTELLDTGYASPTTGLELMALASGETSATITWGSSSASTSSAIALELNASAAPVACFPLTKLPLHLLAR